MFESFLFDGRLTAATCLAIILYSFDVTMLKASVIIFAFMVMSAVAPKVRHRSQAKDPLMDMMFLKSLVFKTKMFNLVALNSKREEKI